MAGHIGVMACAPAYGAPGDIWQNMEAILERLQEARNAGAQVLLLPELCLSTGSCGDAYHQRSLQEACLEAAQQIAMASDELLVVFGLPLLQTTNERRLYNALAIACDGRMLGFVVKTQLNRSQRAHFDVGCPEEIRWFGQALPCFSDGVFSLRALGLPGTALIGFCDEHWPLSTAYSLAGHELVLLADLAPATAAHLQPAFPTEAAWFGQIPCLAYANAGAAESTTDLVYPGDAVIIHEGKVVANAPAFSGEAACWTPDSKSKQLPDTSAQRHVDEPDPQMPYAPKDRQARAAWSRDCIEIAAQGLATRMHRIGSKSATLGVSGGLDSAMALVITKRAFDIIGLPQERIYAYSLPGLGSSARTRANAHRLMEAMGLPPREIDLKSSILRHFEDIGQDEHIKDAAYENAQARERTQVLMDLANRLGGLMVGSGDLSELALGFTTFGGDHMSMYGVNAGLFKTAIRLILHQVAQDAGPGLLQDTLLDILDTPISPELLPGKDGQITQHTEDILGPYVLNDFFLYHHLLTGPRPGDLAQMALDVFEGQFSQTEILQRLRAFYQRFFYSQFKRNCLPDGPQVLGFSLSPRDGYTLPSDCSPALWFAEVDRLITEI